MKWVECSLHPQPTTLLVQNKSHTTSFTFENRNRLPLLGPATPKKKTRYATGQKHSCKAHVTFMQDGKRFRRQTSWNVRAGTQ
jgi:hypothetical protein